MQTSPKRNRQSIRRWVTVCAAAVAGGVVIAGMTIGRQCLEWDGYNVPREIAVTIQHADGRPVAGVVIERDVVAPGFDPAPTGPWPFEGTRSDDGGVLLFAIGGTGASGGSCSYFWGLWTTTRRDDAAYGYRLLLEDREVAWITGEELYDASADARTPLSESLFRSLEHPESFGISPGGDVEQVRIAVTIDDD